MKFDYTAKFKLTLIACVIALSVLQTQAQQTSGTSGLSGNTSQMSDQQIMQLWQQAQKAGMSENDAMSMLVKKGMDPSQVNSFKKRLVQLQGTSKSKFSTLNTIQDTAGFLKDSSWFLEIPQLKKKSNNYGYDFFSNPNLSFEPNLKIATPKNYIVGPDDELSITLTGLNETTADVKITPEGFIQIPYAGIIQVSGLTIEQATQRIRSKIKNVYPALASGRTHLLVTLSNIKSIRISMIGELERPGNYVVSSLASFFNVLYLSGGPSLNGSLRKIELIRNNKVIETVDFYAFLQKGLLNKELRLEDQDVIRFPVYEKRVTLAGEVKRPAVYELLDKETITDLIGYGGGLGDTAYKETAKVVQVGEKERKMRDVSAVDFNYFIPHNADSIYFEKVLPRFSNKVVLSGAVYRPGNYELTENMGLSALLTKANGLREDAFVNRGYIKRRGPFSEKELLSFDPTKIMSAAQPDIQLVKEDSIFIMSRDSLLDIPTLKIGGSVRIPGIFQYRNGITLEDAILMAGGFTNDAANHKVEISRLNKNKADTLANTILEVTTVEVDSSLGYSARKIILQPQDFVFVPRLLNYHNLGNIKLRGEVLYEGDYPLERRDETVQEVIKRAGGLSPYASMQDVQVFRKSTRIATTLLYEHIQQKGAFLLHPEDSIYIPRSEPFVEVKGAVFNPQILSFQSNSFLSYISASGGVTDKANLRKAYVQYSNGINNKIHHFLFFRIYPKIQPGSKIFIPEKSEIKRGLSLIEISSITTLLAALVAIINLLK